jgi:DNA-binding MarR family transcriptional regulator
MPTIQRRRAKPPSHAAAKPATLDSHIGYWMRMVSNQVSGEFKRLLAARGVSVAEWVALRRLFDVAGTTHGELVEALGMTKGAVSKVVHSLERMKLVSRSPDRADARSESLSLTASGRTLVPKLARTADRNEAHFFGHLSATERTRLRAMLTALARHHRFDETPIE